MKKAIETPVLPTTFITNPELDKLLGAKITLASEISQVTGSFKFRAAHNVANSVINSHVITASSGNFGQALACACQMKGKRCTVIMPKTAANVKIQGVQAYGGKVRLADTAKISRYKALCDLAVEFPEAYVASPYDDQLVICGNASLGREIAELTPQPQFVIVPVGGGGLASGIITGLKQANAQSTQVIGAEPLMANDAARSLRSGRIQCNKKEPQTLADGARTLHLGKLNFPILKSGMRSVIEVSEEQITEAVRMLFKLAELKAEPTGALAIAAMMQYPSIFRNKRVCCVISGGNVNPERWDSIINK